MKNFLFHYKVQQVVEKLVVIFVAYFLVVTCSTFIIYVGWNAVVPSIWNLREITFADALILSVLSGTLLKSSCNCKSD